MNITHVNVFVNLSLSKASLKRTAKHDTVNYTIVFQGLVSE